MTEKKYCPILSAGSDENVPCQPEKCAWGVVDEHDEYVCSMTMIAVIGDFLDTGGD